VIGHLAASIDLDYRDISGCEHMLTACIQAEGENRWVLGKPDFVGRLIAA
jgi:hypothetical protein